MISGNDVLNEKEKLALEDLLQFALEKVKKKKKTKNWKAMFSSNLEKMIKMIELNSSIQYELHWHIMGVDMQNQKLYKKIIFFKTWIWFI